MRPLSAALSLLQKGKKRKRAQRESSFKDYIMRTLLIKSLLIIVKQIMTQSLS